MAKRKSRNKRPEEERPLPVLEVEVEDDLAGLSAEEIAAEEWVLKQLGERVRDRLVLSPPCKPPQPQPKPNRKGRNKPPEEERPLPVLEVEVEDDLAGLSEEEIAAEEWVLKQLDERVRYRLALSPPCKPAQPQPKPNSKG
jgi:hypothetical protein